MGDLDDFFWPFTRWFGLIESREIEFIVMVYSGTNPPTLIALGSNTEHGREVLQNIELPEYFHSHLSSPLMPALSGRYTSSNDLKHYRMELVSPDIVNSIDTSSVQQLSSKYLSSIESFYKEAYPGNWFDSRMLETGQTFGIVIPDDHKHSEKRFAAISGIHVYSEKYSVAALGNIAVSPSCRNRGYGKLVSAALVQSLLRAGIITVGLNVEAGNIAAIKCYSALGFEIRSEFYEVMWTSLSTIPRV